MQDLHELAGEHFLATLQALAGELEEDASMTTMDHAKAWHAALNAPLDPKDVRYAKAVSRLMGTPASFYVCVEYRDAEALKGLEILEEYGVEVPEKGTEKDKARYWLGMRMMCRAAQFAVGVEQPRPPTREEIQTNIQQHRSARRAQKSSGSLSLTAAFKTGMSSLGEAIGGTAGEGLKARMEALSDEDAKAASAEWSEGTADGTDERVRERNVDELVSFAWPVLTTDEAAALREALAGPGATQVWSSLEQVVCFSRVQQHIPGNMLSRIEQCAQQLAGDISSGQQSLETLDLAKLGESVLADCSDEDMSQVASNLTKLLPTLTSLQGQMGRP